MEDHIARAGKRDCMARQGRQASVRKDEHPAFPGGAENCERDVLLAPYAAVRRPPEKGVSPCEGDYAPRGASCKGSLRDRVRFVHSLYVWTEMYFLHRPRYRRRARFPLQEVPGDWQMPCIFRSPQDDAVILGRFVAPQGKLERRNARDAHVRGSGHRESRHKAGRCHRRSHAGQTICGRRGKHRFGGSSRTVPAARRIRRSAA